MLKSDVIEFFGTGSEVKRVLGLKSTGTVSQWPEIIPEKQALKIDRLTNGRLAYNPDLYRVGQLTPRSPGQTGTGQEAKAAQ